MNPYEDIIHLARPVSVRHKPMPAEARAAQFAPFAALTGYDSAIRETGRLTDEKIELDEEALTALDMKFQLLMKAIDEEPEASVTYFKPDQRKDGGAYLTETGKIGKIDEYQRLVIMRSGVRIPMDDILQIDFDRSAEIERRDDESVGE